MTTPAFGPAGTLLAVTPLPYQVAHQLAADHLAPLCENPSFPAELRVEHHSRHVDVATATALCACAFSPDEAATILATERRKRPIAALMAAAPPETLVSLFDHQRFEVRAAAVRQLARRPYDQIATTAMLDHLYLLPPDAALRVLVAASRNELSDREVAVQLVGLGDPAGSTAVALEAAKLLACRPGVVTEMLAFDLPAYLWSPMSMSSMATPAVRDAALGAAALLRSLALGVLLERFDEHPGVGDGNDTFSGPLDSFDAEQLERFGEFLDRFSAQTPPTTKLGFASMASNPNMREVSDALRWKVGYALAGCCEGDLELPAWRLDELIDALTERVWPVAMPAVQRRRIAAESQAGERLADEKVHGVVSTAMLRDLPLVAAPFFTPAYSWFADRLGDDVAAWSAAVALADSFDGSLAELADVALSMSVASL